MYHLRPSLHGVTTLVIFATLLLVPAHPIQAHKVRDAFSGNRLGEDTVTCVFERVTEVSYEQGAIIHGDAERQNPPMTFIFTELKSKKPKLKGFGAAGTTYTSDLLMVSNTTDKISLIEVTPVEGNVFIYSLHKNKGVAIWTKHYYGFVDVPLGVISMGKCQ